MNPRVLTALSVWISLLVPSQGCGPFFPDTVLDKPQAALAVPPVSYLHNLCRLAGRPLPVAPPVGEYPDPAPDSLYGLQIPLEVAELRTLWEKEGVAPDIIRKRLTRYEEVRQLLLSSITTADMMSFPTHGDQPPALPPRPLGDDYPPDVADYVEAARLHSIGSSAEARTLWKSILDRPPAERRLRAAWAAWMLAKTSADRSECRSWYERVDSELIAGASDSIGLGPAAKLWRAGIALKSNQAADLIPGVHLAYDVFSSGRQTAARELRYLTSRISSSGDADTLRAAAADPLVRRLVNIDLHAALDGWDLSMEAPVAPDGKENALQPWLTALEAVPSADLDDCSRVAWALYASGRYEESKKWLALCPQNDPLALWLQAKFDLRDGKLGDANNRLAEAVRLQSRNPGWEPKNPADGGVRWFNDSVDSEGMNQSRMLADSGVVSLALKDYLAALESLRKGGYEQDAAYLAECVISLDGLVRHVRKVAPQWTPVVKEEPDSSVPPDPATFLSTYSRFSHHGIGADNQLRYQLARRLARDKRFNDAREFMPPDLLPVFDHYVKIDKARRSGRYSGEKLAAITWRQALMHRHLGAELFSTDCAPDSGALDWSYSGTQFHEIRTLRAGWTYDWSQDPAYIPGIKPEDKAIPEVTTDEVARMKKYSVRPMLRFHYRYTAADLAWQATRLLPPNHPDLTRMYNTAGQWISTRDPKAADRFYQAMVRRCAKTPEGRAADAKRWFLTDLAPLEDLPSLPAALVPPPHTAANP